jgi:hypothetical protein
VAPRQQPAPTAAAAAAAAAVVVVPQMEDTIGSDASDDEFNHTSQPAVRLARLIQHQGNN